MLVFGGTCVYIISYYIYIVFFFGGFFGTKVYRNRTPLLNLLNM